MIEYQILSNLSFSAFPYFSVSTFRKTNVKKIDAIRFSASVSCLSGLVMGVSAR